MTLGFSKLTWSELSSSSLRRLPFREESALDMPGPLLFEPVFLAGVSSAVDRLRCCSTAFDMTLKELPRASPFWLIFALRALGWASELEGSRPPSPRLAL